MKESIGLIVIVVDYALIVMPIITPINVVAIAILAVVRIIEAILAPTFTPILQSCNSITIVFFATIAVVRTLAYAICTPYIIAIDDTHIIILAIYITATLATANAVITYYIVINRHQHVISVYVSFTYRTCLRCDFVFCGHLPILSV
jgi:hypothetical protein